MTGHWAGWGIPREWGGDIADAVDAIARAARVSPAAARRLFAQRAFIELLLHCPNVGLREYRLPMLLAGSLGGWVAAELDTDTGRTVVATETSRGWSLTEGSRRAPMPCRAATDGPSLIARVRPAWAVLRGALP